MACIRLLLSSRFDAMERSSANAVVSTPLIVRRPR
jgi:hypothetical protein